MPQASRSSGARAIRKRVARETVTGLAVVSSGGTRRNSAARRLRTIEAQKGIVQPKCSAKRPPDDVPAICPRPISRLMMLRGTDGSVPGK